MPVINEFGLPRPSSLLHDDLTSGTAMTACQVEGASAADDLSDALWDTTCRQCGQVRGGDNCDVACDNCHGRREDIELLKKRGARIDVS